MAAIAGYPVLVYESPDDAADYVQVNHINNISMGPKRDMLDITAFGTANAAKNFLAGLRSGQFQISGDYDAGDAGQNAARTNYDNGSVIYLQVQWTGGAAGSGGGHKCKCLVSQYDIKATPAGKVEFSATLEFDDKPVTA